jgi:glycosyltransferase involved in cell wall biosynthesis
MITTIPQKVFLAAYDNAEAEKVANNLLRVFEHSDRRHTLVQSPGSADLILIGGIGNAMSQWDYLHQTIRNPLIGRFPEKAFTLSFRDTPVVFNRGVYESAPSHRWNRGRCVTGSYELSGHFNSALKEAATSSKDLLFSFIGRISHPVRRRILALQFRRRDIVLEDTSSFNYWDCPANERNERENLFARVLARSKFCLCPRGVGVGSIRLFEAMRSGVAPVILADDWIPPAGLPWEDFSIQLREDQVHRLEEIVSAREEDYAGMGALARKYWETYFAENTYFDYVVSRCALMRQQQKTPEAFYWAMRYPYMTGYYAYKAAEKAKARIGSILLQERSKPHSP